MSSLFNVLAVGVALMTSALYIYGKKNYFFWYYPWYDIPMHILGGLVIGFWICALAAERLLPLRSTLLLLFVALAVVGGAWEIYEYSFGLIADEENYLLDTASDLGNDVLGGLSAFMLFVWLHRRDIKS